MQNSVHSAEQQGAPGGSQSPVELKARCIEMAGSQNLLQADLEAEVGDLFEYIKAALAARTTKLLRVRCSPVVG
jgi:hypothetical protein